MTLQKENTFRAIAFNTYPEITDGVTELSEAVFYVERLTLSVAYQLANFWTSIGYDAVVYRYDEFNVYHYDEDGKILGVTVRSNASPVSVKLNPRRFYVGRWQGVVDGIDDITGTRKSHSGGHVAVFDAISHDPCALAGPSDDRKSIDDACMFAAAPALLNALEGVLNAFSYAAGSPSEPDWYANARIAYSSAKPQGK